jgi:hypothetical protein
MYPKCSLSDSNIYLQIVGLLSLVIIIIIAGFYYIRVYHNTIKEKYEQAVIYKTEGQLETGNRSTFPRDKYPGAQMNLIGTNTPPTTTDKYELRDCKVYFTDDTGACDGKGDDAKTCSYKYDGWQEFSTYTDKNGKTIEYPKKIYKQDASNTNELINSYFTSKCFKKFDNNGDGRPQPFEYKENNLVKYDSKGSMNNTEIDTNVFGGKKYTSMQFLNTTSPSDNFNNVLDSICSIRYNPIKELVGKKFYKFVLDANKNIRQILKVQLNSDQTTFDIINNNAVLDFSFLGSHGLKFVSGSSNQLEVFITSADIVRPVNVYKFSYVSYICPADKKAQISNFLKTSTEINITNFIQFGGANVNATSANNPFTLPYLDRLTASKYTTANTDYKTAMLKELADKRDARVTALNGVSSAAKDALDKKITDKDAEIIAADRTRNSYYIPEGTFTKVIDLTKANSKIFNYNNGYNNTNLSKLVIPTGCEVIMIENTGDVCLIFKNKGDNQTPYNFSVPASGYTCDILLVGGGGAGGKDIGGGGGGGAVLYGTNISIAQGTYTLRVGRGATTGETRGVSTEGFGATLLGGGCAGNATWSNPTTANSGGSGAGGKGFYQAYSSPSTNAGGGVGISTKGTILNSASLYNGNVGGTAGQQDNTNLIQSAGGGGTGAVGGNGNINGGRTGNGGNGVLVNITGIDYYWGAGGGGGSYYCSPANGGLGGGGAGYDYAYGTGTVGGDGYGLASGYNAGDGTGSGGGGSGYMNGTAGNGGSGIVIIRIKNIIPRPPDINLAIDNYYSIDKSIQNPYEVSLAPYTIQTDIITAFVFLQKGYYRFRADLGTNTNGANPSIKYAQLMIYDESNFDRSTLKYRCVPVFRYNGQFKPAYLKQYVYIPTSKFFKIAYFYLSHNPSSIDTSPFKMYYDYSTAPQQQTYPEDIISSPNVSSNTINNTDKLMIFNYTGDNTGTGQTRYTFTTTEDLICDILLVGGGGAGGKDIGGGGGGGAVLYGTKIGISAGSYTIKVGRGATQGETRGVSTEGFGATLLGGGCAGNANWGNPATTNSGGSGAGGKAYWGVGSSPSTLVAGGVGISTKGTILNSASLYNGNLGGTAVQQVGGDPIQSAGGGGTGAVGGNGNGRGGKTGNGGNGVLVNITGVDYYWGAGGGGGSYYCSPANGGLGGGGAGYDYAYGTGTVGGGGYGLASGYNAGDGTGSGGGGSGYMNGSAGNGGSGIVIIRYRLPKERTAAIPLKDLNDNMNDSPDLYVSNNITNNIKTSMNDYLYYSTTLYNDYKNTDTTVMDIFSIMNYTGNNKNNYRYLATYLNNKVDYFNTDKLLAEKKEWQRQLKIHIDNSSTTITGDQEIIKIDNLSNNIKAINYNEKKPMNAPTLRNVPLTDIFCSSNNNIYLTYDTITNLNGINLLTPNLTPAIYIEAIT